MLPEEPHSQEYKHNEPLGSEPQFGDVVERSPPLAKQDEPKQQPNKQLQLDSLKLFFAAVWRKIWRHRHTIVLTVGVPFTFGIWLFILLMLFLPQNIHYKFTSQTNCVGSPTMLPTVFKPDSKGAFMLSRQPVMSIGHIPILSYWLCANPLSNPLPQTAYISHQWISIDGLHFGKSLKVTTPQYLTAATTLGTKAIPIEKPIQFRLSSEDSTFAYAVVVNDESAPCSKHEAALTCNLGPLNMSYAANYKASLVRVFHGQITGTVLTKTIQTISATAITNTSIGTGSTIYNQPQQITINTSKPLTALQTISLTSTTGSTTTNVPITSSFKGQTITINITSPLARQASFDLHIANLTADDDSTLEQPYDLTFTTSGGPQVTSANIPSYGLASGQAMTVYLSQGLNPSQNPSQYVSLIVNGTAQPATVSQSGQQITITPSTAYPVCATVKVELSAAAQNIYGVSGNSNWSYSSRSHCYTTFSIGTSVLGRPITAYQFGSGSSMVLYIAAMEGNEQNSANLLQQWIPDVDANPQKIPSYRTLVIIPQINPDGYAADTRLNADGIDLNRNFPSNNWQEQVTEPLANTVWTNDGGPNPLSEPESQALASYYEAHRPRLAITEHSHGGIVEANDAGDSVALGAQYASLADYKPIPTADIGNFFDYTTTGAFEDWANDKLGLPVLEVELESPTNDEYSRNLPALWATAQVSP